MGQKVNPIGLRVGVVRDWDAAWYADKTQVSSLLLEDLKVREYLEKAYKGAAVSRVIVERVRGAKSVDRIKITLFTGKPGVVIGQGGETKNKVVESIKRITKKDVILNVIEVRRPEIDATLVAQNIAEQLEARASFRRVQKVAMARAMKSGAKGFKSVISGRLGGAEIARSEGYNEGRVPLQTLRADIDYAFTEAHTTYGKLGIKVWIYKGEVFEYQSKDLVISKGQKEADKAKKDHQNRRNPKDFKGGKKPFNKKASDAKAAEAPVEEAAEDANGGK